MPLASSNGAMGLAKEMLGQLTVVIEHLKALDQEQSVLQDRLRQIEVERGAIYEQLAGGVATPPAQPQAQPQARGRAVSAATDAMRRTILRALPPTTEPGISLRTLTTKLAAAGEQVDGKAAKKKLANILSAMVSDGLVVVIKISGVNQYQHNNTLPEVAARVFVVPPSLAGNGRN